MQIAKKINYKNIKQLSLQNFLVIMVITVNL